MHAKPVVPSLRHLSQNSRCPRSLFTPFFCGNVRVGRVWEWHWRTKESSRGRMDLFQSWSQCKSSEPSVDKIHRIDTHLDVPESKQLPRTESKSWGGKNSSSNWNECGFSVNDGNWRMIEVQQPRTSSSSNCKGNDLGALDFKDFSGFFNFDRRRFCFQGKFPTFAKTEKNSVLLTYFVFPPRFRIPEYL